MKRRRWYLITFVIGIVLIISGIFTLDEAIGQKNNSAIWIRSLMLFFWIVFTATKFFLYKKELQKNKER